LTRTTNTRERVRELADKISNEGGTPTPTLIRSLLGTGSPNTIVSELKAWQNAQQHRARTKQITPEHENVAPPHPPATNDVTSLVENQLLQLLAEMPRTSAKLKEVTGGYLEVLAQLSELRQSSVAELKTMSTRLDSVQRYMLLQINEAREESIRWRQKHQLVKDEFGQWQTTMRQKINALSDENSWLKGKLNQPAPSLQQRTVSLPARQEPPPSGRTPGYSGHPRASPVSDE
jgi:hypothetical protein